MYPLARAMAAGRACFVSALDLVLPARCLTCEAAVPAPGNLCAYCFTATDFITDPCCHRCGTPFGHSGEGGLAMTCVQCSQHPPPWRQARAALRYDDQARRMVLPLKYGDRVENAHALGRHMARAGAALLRDADLLVPVPLHRRRLLARRYNQAALLAQAIARFAQLHVAPDALRRIRATATLSGMTRQQRADTVAGAFVVPAARAAFIAGRRVVLVDDVLTSGATAAACTRVLLHAGAERVDLLVAARADHHAPAYTSHQPAAYANAAQTSDHLP